MFDLINLSVNYGDKTVLSGASLSLDSGKITALIGPNGSGKSSLIRAASGVLPSTGEIRLNGQDLRLMPIHQRARQLAVLPQTAWVPPAFSVWETVLLGRAPHLNFLGQLSKQDEEIARQALKQVDGLDLINRRMGELSGGEQQRVLLARALAQQASVLLLDEPTTHLDLHHQMGLLERVKELAVEQKLTVLLALHDLNLAARYADKVVLLSEGRLVLSGLPREVLKAEVLSQVYQWPVQVREHPFKDVPLVLPD